jgi:hypothetical protein
VLVDVSRAVASAAEARDSVMALATSGTVVLKFDSATGPLSTGEAESLESTGARGSLSAGLVAAMRALGGTAADADPVELVIVSPVVREEVDSATMTLLRMWNGPIRLARVAPAAAPRPARWTMRARGDDPVVAALSGFQPAPAGSNAAGVRLVRTEPTRADSLWARDSAGALVIWPDAERQGGMLTRRARADSQPGVASRDAVVIGEFMRGYGPRPGTPLVRWIDGEPAATEVAFGTGCIREVAIPVDDVGDLALRGSFRRIARSLVVACGGERDFQPVALSQLTGDDASAASPGATPAPPEPTPSGKLPLWLALAALAALLMEQAVRSRGAAPVPTE